MAQTHADKKRKEEKKKKKTHTHTHYTIVGLTLKGLAGSYPYAFPQNIYP